MASNPMVPLGQLNRLRASVLWANFQNLNVNASFLGKEGIRFTPEGESAAMIEVMVGAVPSPEPYLLVTARIAIVKSTALSDAYKRQWENNSLIGNCTIRPDATQLSPFPLFNCSIASVEGLTFNGEEATYPVNIRGTYYINSQLWSQA